MEPDLLNNLKSRLQLYAIPCEGTETELLLDQVRQAIEGGVTIVQLREKKLTFQEYLAKATKVKAVCDEYGVPLIIDDSVDVALACEADGVHLGQEDLDVATARACLGPDKIIGVSAKTVSQATHAQVCGANYLGVGAIFPTKTKKNPIITPVERLRDICNSVTIPVVAIGGLKLSNIGVLRNSGIVGIAVVTGIFSEPDIKDVAQKFKAQVLQLLN